MGLLDLGQRIGGSMYKIGHTILGFKATYTLCTNEDVEGLAPVVLSPVYMRPLSEENVHEAMGGAERSVIVGGKKFEVSRKFFKIAGVYYDPTTHDFFVEYGTTEPMYRVTKVWKSTERLGMWRLTGMTVKSMHAKG